jgi:hypothetical protein
MEPLPKDLSLRDMTIIRYEGALKIPNAAALGGLVKSFCQHVYCEIPVVDLSHVLEVVRHRSTDEPRRRVSILLLNAILLAGALHTPLEIVHQAGYESRDDAISSLYGKVRVLYLLDCETDTTTVLQALLILAYACSNPILAHKQVYWIKIAVSLCHRIVWPQHLPEHQDSTHRLWKRLWWSCYVLDKLIAVEQGSKPC